MVRGMQELQLFVTPAPVAVIQCDARHTHFADNSFGFVLNHPPYFALYKYSSDVLRFELEWGRFERGPIAEGEIRDGFKTTDPDTLDDYITDMAEVFREAHRILKPGRRFCLVVNDSTLRDVQLPVIERLTYAATNIGFSVDEHLVRDVMFSQARYHQSADTSIQTKEDHVIYFRK
jgi:DNA modification methylase